MGTVASLGRLADLAEAQNGLLTSRQADLRGVPRRDLTRLSQSGGLERVAYGVYRVAGAPRPRLLELRAAWLQLAPGVDVDRRTVAHGVVHTADVDLVVRAASLDAAVDALRAAAARNLGDFFTFRPERPDLGVGFHPTDSRPAVTDQPVRAAPDGHG